MRKKILFNCVWKMCQICVTKTEVYFEKRSKKIQQRLFPEPRKLLTVGGWGRYGGGPGGQMHSKIVEKHLLMIVLPVTFLCLL